MDNSSRLIIILLMNFRYFLSNFIDLSFKSKYDDRVSFFFHIQ